MPRRPKGGRYGTYVNGNIGGVQPVETDLIKSDPKFLMGKPIIAGTRIPVDLILEKLAQGETVEQIIQAHPRLTEEAIRAALAFAAEAIRADVVYPVQEEVQ
ncbi:MAG: DUF433 domain-containing protein [Clostridia bacterium]|nr:DUF433 domain-containing protein [Clostridia bacterium]